MLRGSVESGVNLDKSAEDLTLDMLGNSQYPRKQNPNVSDDVVMGDD
jgi:hypothetical protein